LLARVLHRADTNPADTNDWKEVRLGEVATLNPANESPAMGTIVSFVPMDGVSEEGQLTYWQNVKCENVVSGYTSFQNNDVLVAKITPCFENGKGAFVKGIPGPVGYGSTEFHVIRAREESSARFIYHVTCSSRFRSRGELHMQGSAGQKRVPTDYLKKYTFFMPRSQGEQLRVAQALDRSDSLLQLFRKNLQILLEEKKGLMQRLLDGKSLFAHQFDVTR
jgi:type I restriction enzyme S subunit